MDSNIPSPLMLTPPTTFLNGCTEARLRCHSSGFIYLVFWDRVSHRPGANQVGRLARSPRDCPVPASLGWGPAPDEGAGAPEEGLGMDGALTPAASPVLNLGLYDWLSSPCVTKYPQQLFVWVPEMGTQVFNHSPHLPY